MRVLKFLEREKFYALYLKSEKLRKKTIREEIYLYTYHKILR